MTGHRGSRGLRGSLVVGRLAVLAAMVTAGTARAAPAEGASPWRTDFDRAKTEARRLERPLLLHFSAEWCGPCRKMEHNVLSAPQVVRELADRVVPVRIDADEHPELARRFNVRALPTDVYIDPGGNVLARYEGYQERAVYLARLSRVETEFQQSGSLHTAGHGDSSPAPADETISGGGRRRPSVPFDPDLPRIVKRRADDEPSQRAPSVPQNREWNAPSGRTAPEPDRPAPFEADGFDADGDDRKFTERSAAPASDDPFGSDPGSDSTADPGSVGDTATEAEGSPESFTASSSPHRRSSEPPRVGLEGYSPVSLKRDREWRKGRKDFSAVYRGVIYRMASRDELEAFHSNPSRYAPRLSGCDPVRLRQSEERVKGSVRFAAYFGEKLYLFTTAENRMRFKKNPVRYAE